MKLATLLRIALLVLCATACAADVSRFDFYVESDPGIHVFIREVSIPRSPASQEPVLLIHGARVPGVASFDLPVEGGSLAADLFSAALRTIEKHKMRGIRNDDCSHDQFLNEVTEFLGK